MKKRALLASHFFTVDDIECPDPLRCCLNEMGIPSAVNANAASPAVPMQPKPMARPEYGEAS